MKKLPFRIRRSAQVLVLVSLFCGLVAMGCDDLVADPNFHTWCGDQLCSWKLESGQIRKSPTWHTKDFGVELMDPDAKSRVTALSQVVNQTPKCLEFSVIADVTAQAQVAISVDFDADGTAEYEQPIAALGFREQKTQITAPVAYTGIKFTIVKRGSGRAVLAQMDVRSITGCTAPPLELEPQVIGTQCPLTAGNGDMCLSGVCCEGMCAECCVSPNPRFDEEGGIEPDPKNTCGGGAKCAALPLGGAVGRGLSLLLLPSIPRQCEPGVRKRAAGAECLLAEDCTSGACDGAEWTLVNLAVDGGACAAPPTPDPSCNVTSVRAGRCR